MEIDTIIQGCIANDRQAQEALYRRYFAVLRSMCLRYTNDQDRIITIINDGMLKVFKHIDQFEVGRNLDAWVRTIVFRSLSDHFRKENTYLKFLILEEEDKSRDTGLTSIDMLGYEDLSTIIDMLPPMTRKVFILYAIEGYTHKEIGSQLGMSDGTSKWHLSEGRKRLRQIINTEFKEYNYGKG